MAQEFWPLAKRDEGAEPKPSVTETRRRREPGCTGDNPRRQRPKEQARLLPLFPATKFSGVEQASRLLFSLPEGRRDGHPTAHNIETFSTKESRLLYIMGLTRMALS